MVGETILCIATVSWSGLWGTTQQIISRIAQRNRVLYFEPGRNPERRHSAEMWRNWPNFLVLRFQVMHENLTLISTPCTLPYMRQRLPRLVLNVTTPAVARINASILIRHVRRAMETLRVEAPILWLYDPRHIYLVGNFSEKLVCYHNYDEAPAFLRNARMKNLLRRYDDELSSRADVVLTTGRAQWDRRRKLNPNCYFVPNGVDFDVFHKALDPETPIPSELANLPKPIIGFVGLLGYHTDVELLSSVAQTYRNCSLVLVGPDEIPSHAMPHRLRAMKNVHFLGGKDIASLPEYLKAFDVALMPYLLAGHALTAYPLKLHEYLAAGRAVVATALPELRPYAGVLRIAETREDFVRQIDESLRDNNPQAIEARVAIARENTWDQRIAQIYGVLDQMLSTKNQRPVV